MLTFAGFGAGKQRAHLVLGDVVLINRVEVVRVFAVVAAEDDDLLLVAARNVDAAEGVDFRQLVARGLQQGPVSLVGVELEDLAGGVYVVVESADEVDLVLGPDERVLGARSRTVSLGLDTLPLELLHLVVQVDRVKVRHHSSQNLVAAIKIKPTSHITLLFIKSARRTIASNRDVLTDYFAFSPSFDLSS
jgi:hypothetical protein